MTWVSSDAPFSGRSNYTREGNIVGSVTQHITEVEFGTKEKHINGCD